VTLNSGVSVSNSSVSLSFVSGGSYKGSNGSVLLASGASGSSNASGRAIAGGLLSVRGGSVLLLSDSGGIASLDSDARTVDGAVGTLSLYDGVASSASGAAVGGDAALIGGANDGCGNPFEDEIDRSPSIHLKYCSRATSTAVITDSTCITRDRRMLEALVQPDGAKALGVFASSGPTSTSSSATVPTSYSSWTSSGPSSTSSNSSASSAASTNANLAPIDVGSSIGYGAVLDVAVQRNAPDTLVATLETLHRKHDAKRAGVWTCFRDADDSKSLEIPISVPESVRVDTNWD